MYIVGKSHATGITGKPALPENITLLVTKIFSEPVFPGHSIFSVTPFIICISLCEFREKREEEREREGSSAQTAKSHFSPVKF